MKITLYFSLILFSSSLFADPNQTSALESAIMSSDVAKVKATLTEHAPKLPFGLSPLIVAGFQDDEAVVQALAQGNSLINHATKDGSMHPLAAYALLGKTAFVMQLLRLPQSTRPNVDQRILIGMHAGWTALMCAAWKGNATICQHLLKGGALPDITIEKGKLRGYTAWSIAHHLGHAEVKDILERNGCAKPWITRLINWLQPADLSIAGLATNGTKPELTLEAQALLVQTMHEWTYNPVKK